MRGGGGMLFSVVSEVGSSIPKPSGGKEEQTYKSVLSKDNGPRPKS